MSGAAELRLNEAIAVLARTPMTLSALLSGLPDLWLRGTDGPGTWNVYDVIGHLIAGERSDWMPRVRLVLEHGEAHPFEPFDRFSQSGAPQDLSLDLLLAEFASLRRENVAALKNINLQPGDMQRRGRHPALGAVTLSELLATWVVHDLTHLHQVSRLMANQYRGLVGPWNAYLGVLQCNGHSS